MILFEIAALFLSPFRNLLELYVRWLMWFVTSPAAKRRVVQAMVACIVFGLLVGLALFAYLVFYWVYIPQPSHVGRIHFQHGQPTHGGVTPGPFAYVEFPKSLLSSGFLRGGQGYDITVDLAVPSSLKNLDIGNFMVTVKLLNYHGDIIAKSSRSAILTYYSLPARIVRALLRAVPHVLWWSREEQRLRVELMRSFVEDSNNPVATVFVGISSPDLSIYQATLRLDAGFRGLRRLMYYNRITTALIFMFGFVMCEVIFAVSAWTLLTRCFGESSMALAPAPAPMPQRVGTGSVYKEVALSLKDKDLGSNFEEDQVGDLKVHTDEKRLEASDVAQTPVHATASGGAKGLCTSEVFRRRQRMARGRRSFAALGMERGSSISIQELQPNTRSAALL